MKPLISDRKILFGCFFVMVAMQMAVPVLMIARHEIVLDTGTIYKFRTAPVDPYDAFRGKYVTLRFESTTAPYSSPLTCKNGQRVYATLKVNADGFAGFSRVAETPPTEGDYLGVDFGYGGNGTCSFSLPFDRYYLEESMAPEAERLYNAHSRNGVRDAWVLVRVSAGKAVIEDLYVGGKPVKALILENRALEKK